MDNRSTAGEKLLAVKVDEDLRPDIGDLSDKDVRFNQSAGSKLSEADLMGNEFYSKDSGGAIPCFKLGEREEEGLTAALGVLSCSSVNEQTTEDDASVCTKPFDGPPSGFFFIFPRVDLKSLLTLERVSKPVRNGVNDVLVWRKLHVEPPLSRKLSDDILLSLFERTKGNLKCLSLVECFRITDATLAHVLSLSPQLKQLCIPGCTGLSADGVVSMVQQHAKEFRAKGMPGIKQMRIRGIYNMTQQHLEALLAVVMFGRGNQAVHTKPVHRNTDPVPIMEDDRVIDVEICPRCGNGRPTVVYDCTKESCQTRGRLDPIKACRGCMMCLPRCIQCGTCLQEDEEWEETCCADFVCLSCWLNLPKCSKCNTAFCGKHRLKFYAGDTYSTICEICLWLTTNPLVVARRNKEIRGGGTSDC